MTYGLVENLGKAENYNYELAPVVGTAPHFFLSQTVNLILKMEWHSCKCGLGTKRIRGDQYRYRTSWSPS
ncbi:hypothetical protein Ct9H90mP29_13100 [bacterium]|nr:MAG: hypothetical protein Ct9H90mP29_13100 [bacterium]